MTSAGQFGPYPFIDSRGNALPGVELRVYDPTGTTLASLYVDSDRSSALTNPIPTGVADGVPGVDTAGNAIFYADAGEYLMVVRYRGSERYRAPITISADPADANAVLSVNGRSGIVIGLAEQTALAQEAADRATADGVLAAAITQAITTAEAFAIQRGNHTGSQLAATISDLTEAVQDIAGALVVAGANVTVTYNDVAGTLTIAVSGLTEAVQDVVGALGFGGAGLTATYDDTANTLVLDVNVDGSSIEISADALRVKAAGITNAMLAGSIDQAKITNLVSDLAGKQASGTSVLLAGDQSVDGTKTFLDPPSVPDPVGVTDAVNRRTAIASISAAGGLPGTLDEARDSLRMMDLFRHDDDPQYSVWRQDTQGQQAWWLSRFIGDGRYEAVEIRTVVVGGSDWNAGMTCAQIRRHQLRRPLLSIAFAAGSVTFTPPHASGIWTEITDAAVPGGQYRYDATAGRIAEWTTPADVEVAGVNTFVTTNGGYGVVKIDGDATRATLCPTAQDEVDAGRLSSTALVANGGTLNPTDRLWNNYGPSNKDFYAVFADDLAAGVHVVRITVTGYAPTASTGARIYVADFTYWKAGVTFASADVTRAVLEPKLFNQSTVGEFALEVRPEGASTAPFLGGSHGEQQLAPPTITVDGSPVTLDNLEGVDGDEISITRYSELKHPDLGDTVIANVTVTWKMTTKGLVVHPRIEWLVNGTLSDGGSYTAMMGGDKSLNRGRTTGGEAVDLASDDSSFKSGSRASAAVMWEGGPEGHAAILIYVPDVGAALTDWQYLDLENGYEGVAPATIQDRDDLINKAYFNRGDEPFRAGDVWDWEFVMSAAYFDDPEATLASPVPLDDAVAALDVAVSALAETVDGLGALAVLDTVTSAYITDGTIALADQADVTQARIRGRKSGAGTGPPQDMTAAETVAILSGAIGQSDVSGLVAALAAKPAAVLSGIDLTRTTKTFNTYRQLPLARAGVDAFATFVPLIVAKGGKIGNVRLRTVTTAASGGSGTRARVGVYASDATTLAPTGSALFDFGDFDLTPAVGTRTPTTPSTSGVLPAGLLWLCLTLFGYTTQPSIYSQHNESWFFVESPTNVITPAAGYQQAIASSALPTVDGTLAVVGGSTLLPAFQIVPAA